MWFPQSIRRKVIQKMFALIFDSYDYPFTKSDDVIGMMQPGEKLHYYRKAMEVSKNPAYRQEMQESIRYFYQELAVKKESPEHDLLMQGALLFIKNFDSRMTALGQASKAPTVTDIDGID